MGKNGITEWKKNIDYSGGLEKVIDEFEPVSLEELSANPLMDRYDEKYLLPVSAYTWLLPELINYYRVLDMEGIRNYRYVSTYFDTPSGEMYRAHQNGKKNRYKIRFRQYVYSGKVYLEVKHKINKGKTFKKRLERPGEEEALSPESMKFIREYSPYDPGKLSPALTVSFSRITLSDPVKVVRFTFDHHLEFTAGEKKLSLPETGVLEVKHPGRKDHSQITTLLEKYRIFPSRFSKYCTGMALLCPGIKYNRFKPLLLSLNKMHYGTLSSYIAG